MQLTESIIEAPQRPSPGRLVVEAYQRDGLDARVDFDYTITDSVGSFRRKPRRPTRYLFKNVVYLSEQGRRAYWHESTATPDEPAVLHGEQRRELANHFHATPIPPLLTTTGWVRIPPGLVEDPAAFESFVNARLIFRLGTAENHTLLCAEGGLLTLPQINRLTGAAPFGSSILAACNEVEQMGCTADGLVLNPLDYYRYLEAGRLMQTLEDNGVFIVRTRLVEPGVALVGDFAHGAQLFDAGRSTIQFAEPPPGTFAEPGIALKAEIHERPVVNLPFTFHLVSL
ncbi:MAG: family 3 encapsulin nanocompartment shell protein [Jatrophihabitantaceae bacterium]